MIVITIILAYFEAYYDSNVFLKGKRQNYLLSNIYRVIVLSIISFYGYWIDLPHYAILWLLNAFTYWIVFDLCFNILVQFPWNYIGKTSKIDRFMRRFGRYYAFSIKLILWALAVFMFVYYFDIKA